MNTDRVFLAGIARVFLNPRADRTVPYGPRQQAVLNARAFATAQAEITRWPGYAPTPLRRLDALAARLGIAGLWYKDESTRFGLGSFKALGGAYGVLRTIQREVERRTGRRPDAAMLMAGAEREILREIVVTCATDGNHGRSVAWGAGLFGARSVIYVHETVSQARADIIAGFGATVRRVPGNYDDAVRQAATDARRQGWFVVSDTAYPGYTQVPGDVMQGYALMAEEVRRQLPQGILPSHLFLQGGVGGMAGAVTAHFWENMAPAPRPFVAIAEPEAAACLHASAKAGRPTVVHGALDTLMAGLACGEPSLIAWEILETGADAFMTLPDPAAVDCMRLLASGGPAGAEMRDVPVVAGESAVAGLAALIEACGDPRRREALSLGPESHVLVMGTEGDTDPALYETLVGRPAAAVREAQRAAEASR